jgi:hypothetical protein
MTRAIFILLLAACEAPSIHENSRPVFSHSDPTFGPIISAAGQSLELTLAAQDRDPDPATEKLYVRLFKLGNDGPSSRLYVGDSTTLSYPADSDFQNQPLTPLAGSLFGPTGADLCAIFSDGELFVVVADRPFSDAPGEENLAPGGLTDENHWELSCK